MELLQGILNGKWPCANSMEKVGEYKKCKILLR